MDFLALSDDIKFIISKHLQSYCKINKMLSKHHDLQKMLFGEIVFDDDFCTFLKLQYDAKENDDTYVCMYIRIYVCIYVCIYIHTCCVLTNPPIPS
jgi:hypothetical protein